MVRWFDDNSVWVPPPAMAALLQHRRQQLKERGQQIGKADDFVFAGQTGQPLDLRNIAARHCKPLLQAYYRLPELRVYDLRHTYASNALAETKDAGAVAKTMGHTSPVMVLTVYGHVLEGQEDEVAAKLAARYAAVREA